MASRQGTPYLLLMIGIYKITSPSNKVYIGQSTNIEKRWKGYSTNKKKIKEQTKLFNSFRKYGVDNHKFEIIEECTKDKLNDKEVYWIEFYNSVNAGLNVSKGGHYFWEVNKGKKHSEATIGKMKEWWAENAKPRSLETIQKITQTKKQNPRNTTPELIEKYRQTSTLKKPIYQFLINGDFVREFESINDASRSLGIRNDGISACLRGLQKSSGGFIWKYKEI